MKKQSDEYFNEASVTAGGTHTPQEHEEMAATDPISNAVEEIIENVRQTFHIDDQEDDENVTAVAAQPLFTEEQEATEVNPVAEEGTPVDPVAPPTDIVNGTDLLNGYNGEEDDVK
jgi:hypothetical protein